MAATKQTARTSAEVQTEAHIEAPGPTEIRSASVRAELLRASVWLGLALLIGVCIVLIQPILLIFAGIVMAAILDGGTRLLGRVLPIGRGWGAFIVCLSGPLVIVWAGTFARAQHHPPGAAPDFAL